MAENIKERKITAQRYDLLVAKCKDNFSVCVRTREFCSVEDLARLFVFRRMDLKLNTLVKTCNLLKEVVMEKLTIPFSYSNNLP